MAEIGNTRGTVASLTSTAVSLSLSHLHTYFVVSAREKKVVTMDDSAIKDLIREDETDDKENDKAAIRKAKNKVKARLAQEQKKADKLAKQQPKAKKGGIKDEDDDDDDDDDAAGLETFAKTSIKKKK